MSTSIDYLNREESTVSVIENEELNTNRYQPRNESYYRILNSNLAEVIPTNIGTMLDVGCGIGVLGGHLKKKNPALKIWGIEEVASIANRAKEKLDSVVVGNIEENIFLPFENNFFDVIVFDESLGLFKKPEVVVQKILQYLKPEGRIIASCSNMAHWSVIMQLVRGEIELKEQSVFDPDRIRFFTSKTAKDLFENLGLNVEKVDRISMPSKRAIKYLTQLAEDFNYDVTGLAEEWSTYQFILSAVKKCDKIYPERAIIEQEDRSNNYVSENENRAVVKSLIEEAGEQREASESLRMAVAEQLLKNEPSDSPISIIDLVNNKPKEDNSAKDVVDLNSVPAMNNPVSTDVSVIFIHNNKDLDFLASWCSIYEECSEDVPIYILNNTDQDIVTANRNVLSDSNVKFINSISEALDHISSNNVVFVTSDCIVAGKWYEKLSAGLSIDKFVAVVPTIDAFDNSQHVKHYVPSDISGNFNNQTINTLLEEYNNGKVHEVDDITSYCIAFRLKDIHNLRSRLPEITSIDVLKNTLVANSNGSFGVVTDTYVHIEVVNELYKMLLED